MCVYIYDVCSIHYIPALIFYFIHSYTSHIHATYSYDGHWTTPSLLPSEYKSTVYKIILQNATGSDTTAYNTIKQTYYTTTDNAEKRFAFTIGNIMCIFSYNVYILCTIIIYATVILYIYHFINKITITYSICIHIR